MASRKGSCVSEDIEDMTPPPGHRLSIYVPRMSRRSTASLQGYPLGAARYSSHSSSGQTAIAEEAIKKADAADISDDEDGATDNDRRFSKFDLDRLRRLFSPELEKLYFRYFLRLERWTFMTVLVVTCLFTLINVVLFNTTFSKTASFTEDARASSVFLFATVACIALFAASLHTRIYYKYYTWLAVLYWLLMVGLSQMLLYTSGGPPTRARDVTAVDRVPIVFFTCFVVHTMLPVSRRLSVIFGFLAALIPIFSTAIAEEYWNTTDNDKCLCCEETHRFPVFQMLADILIYLGANLAGFCHKHLLDVAHRHTILDVKQFAENKIRAQHKEKYSGQLLSSLLPEYLVELIISDFMEYTTSPGDERKQFSPHHIRRFENISILFADIVNFTVLTNTLKEPQELVSMLNELYGNFDKCAKERDCLRIKTLGDCYECVSGMPDPRPDHAKNLVRVGIRMIQILREIREKVGGENELMADLDMRIGIHSGAALSGIIGQQKWTYDVWSNDVQLANQLESTGRRGMVHVSETTLRLLLGELETHSLEENFSCLVDENFDKTANGAVYEIMENQQAALTEELRTFFLFEITEPAPLNNLDTIAERDEENESEDLQESGNFEEDDADDLRCVEKLQHQQHTNEEEQLPTVQQSMSQCGEVRNGYLPRRRLSATASLSSISVSSLSSNDSVLSTETDNLDSLIEDTPVNISIVSSRQSPGPERSYIVPTTHERLDLGLSSERISVVVDETKAEGSHSRRRSSSRSVNKLTPEPDPHKRVKLSPRSSPRIQKRNHVTKKPQVAKMKRRQSMADVVACGAVKPFEEIAEQLENTEVSQEAINQEISLRFNLTGDEDEDLFQIVLPEATHLNLLGRLSTSELRKAYEKQVDTDFVYCVVSALISFLLMMFMQYLLLNVQVLELTKVTGTGTVFLLLIILLTIPSYPKKLQKLQWLRNTAMFILRSVLLKFVLMAMTTGILTVGALYVVTSGDYSESCGTVGLNVSNINYSHLSAAFQEHKHCCYADYYLYSFLILVCCVTLFVRMDFYLKALLMFAIAGAYLTVFIRFFPDAFIYFHLNLREPDVPVLQARGGIYITMMAITFMILDNQVERNFKLDLVYVDNCKKEKKRLRLNNVFCQLILENILPTAALSYFSNPRRDRNALYSQRFRGVCVMFASIPNYRLMAQSNDSSSTNQIEGLNKIITEFDELLFWDEFGKVMKIKTIGSTYMTATGLDADSSKEDDQEDQHVLITLKFANELMETLNRIPGYHNYHHRIGIYIGEVIAGVAGAEKPQYDIWGNCVNRASRMESHGEQNLIQFPYEIFEILRSCSYLPVMEKLGFEVVERRRYIRGIGDMDLHGLKKVRFFPRSRHLIGGQELDE